MKKAAICISGHFRNIARDTFYTNFVDKLREQFEVDIFISTWRENDCNDTPGYVEKNLKVSSIQKSNLDEIISFYNPTSILINDYDKVRHIFHYKNYLNYEPYKSNRLHYIINDVLIASPQLYGIYLANNLKIEHEFNNNFDYDLVFRVRPDFEFCHPFEVEITNDLVVPIIYKEPDSNGGSRIYALDDRFAYSNSWTMDRYSETFLRLKSLIVGWNKDDFPYNSDEGDLQHLSCERILHRNMVELGIGFKENGIKLVRSNKK